MKSKKYEYNVYGLRVVGEENVFYVGITRQPVEKRLKGHLAEVNSKSNPCPKRKKKAFVRAKDKVDVFVIKTLFATKRMALKEEAVVIRDFMKKGHKLINAAFNDNVRDGVGIMISRPVAMELRRVAMEQNVNPTRLATKIIRQYLKTKIAA